MDHEESYADLVSEHAQDKDAVVSAMLICETAVFLEAAREEPD